MKAHLLASAALCGLLGALAGAAPAQAQQSQRSEQEQAQEQMPWNAQALGRQTVNMDFSKVTERSGALSFDVPTHWSVDGRWYAPATVDKRFVVTVRSPNRKVFIQLADADIPLIYWLPGLGIAPGRVVNADGMLVGIAPYATGVQFAGQYASARLPRQIGCNDLRITDAVPAPVPDNVEGPPGLDRHFLTNGYVFFTCNTPKGELLDGVASAVTTGGVIQSGNRAWAVLRLWYYVSSPKLARPTFLIARRITDSIQINKEWVKVHFGKPLPPEPTNPAYLQGPPHNNPPSGPPPNTQYDNAVRHMEENNALMNDTNEDVRHMQGTYGPEDRPYSQGTHSYEDPYGHHVESNSPFVPPGMQELQPR